MDKLTTILETLAESIEAKKQTIAVRDWELEKLRKQLADAETYIAELEATNAGVLCGRTIEYRKEN